MKRAEQLAWAAMVGLVAIAGLLLGGAMAYRITGFWAGGLLAAGQALVMGLAAWGLSLARQARELNELPSGKQADFGTRSEAGGGGGGAGFRMSMGGDEGTRTQAGLGTEEPKVLDTGFQRLLVGIAGVVQVILAGLLFWALYAIYSWTQANPEKILGVAGILGKPAAVNETALLIGLTASGVYGALYWLTRPSRQTGMHGEAASSNFTLGLTGMAALGVATVLGYFRVVWAAEVAAGIVAAFMLLQGLELIVNACRSYSSIEELDQEAVDLQATPLGPMLSSVWLGGLRMLVAQSVGLSGDARKGEASVVTRMMPRVLLAIVVIAVVVSCIRVVPPGQVAIRERLGYTPTVGPEDPRPLPDAILHSGVHFTMPWPIDQLVYLPTEQLQLTDVGTELHASGEWKNVDFQFWMVRPPGADQQEVNDLFITGDPGSPQFLETYIQVRWRVKDASRFYASMSHSEMFDPTGGSANSRVRAIYEALVEQATSESVTETFAIHSLEQILLTDKEEVELHCRDILQKRLDDLCRLPGDPPDDPKDDSKTAGAKHRGMEVAYLTIKDLHPPYWHADRPDSAGPLLGGQPVESDAQPWEVVDDPRRSVKLARGPASAFELVVAMREFRQEIMNMADERIIAAKNKAHGDALSAIAEAEADSIRKVAEARGDADRFAAMTQGMSALDLELLKRRLMMDTTRDLYDPVTKLVVDPRVGGVEIIQNSDKGGNTGFRPPGQ